MNYLKNHKFSLLVLLGLIVSGLYFYPTLPAEVPTKFDLEGHPIKYAPKAFFVFMIPAIYFVVLAVLPVYLKTSPKKFAMENSRRSIDVLMTAVGLLLVGVHVGTVLDPVGGELFRKCLCYGMAAFLILAGNVTSKTERNFFFGARLPWALNSDANWKATHRFMAKLMVAGGLLLLVSTWIQPNLFLAFAIVVAVGILPAVYSYRYYIKNEKALDPEA